MENVCFENLPDSVLGYCFSFLGSGDKDSLKVAHSVRLVCKKWKTVFEGTRICDFCRENSHFQLSFDVIKNDRGPEKTKVKIFLLNEPTKHSSTGIIVPSDEDEPMKKFQLKFNTDELKQLKELITSLMKFKEKKNKIFEMNETFERALAAFEQMGMNPYNLLVSCPKGYFTISMRNVANILLETRIFDLFKQIFQKRKFDENESQLSDERPPKKRNIFQQDPKDDDEDESSDEDDLIGGYDIASWLHKGEKKEDKNQEEDDEDESSDEDDLMGGYDIASWLHKSEKKEDKNQEEEDEDESSDEDDLMGGYDIASWLHKGEKKEDKNQEEDDEEEEEEEEIKKESKEEKEEDESEGDEMISNDESVNSAEKRVSMIILSAFVEQKENVVQCTKSDEERERKEERRKETLLSFFGFPHSSSSDED